jgi:hypothetical protein
MLGALETRSQEALAGADVDAIGEWAGLPPMSVRRQSAGPRQVEGAYAIV